MSQTMEMPPMPLLWPEKLERLQVGESELIENSVELGTASMAKVRVQKRTSLEFKVRTNKKTGETRIYRTK